MRREATQTRLLPFWKHEALLPSLDVPIYVMRAPWIMVDPASSLSRCPSHCLAEPFSQESSELPASKAIAQLSLEKFLQGANSVGALAHTKLPSSKGRDAKPRLLLMGLRRYVRLPTD